VRRSEGPGKRHLPRQSLIERAAARRRARRELADLGIKRSRASDAPIWSLATLLTVAAAAGALGAVTGSFSTDEAVALAAAVLTVAGLLVAVLQWRQGLAEKAFDALYQRIALANRMRLEAFQDAETQGDDEVARKHPELYRFFVFTEIDSLEYAARRYRFGLGLNADIVDRAVRHFRGRCDDSATFRTAAADCVESGAYFPDTKATVASILDEVESRHASEAGNRTRRA
jgi:hypothetical protein